MVKYCGEECVELCDFCVHYVDNGTLNGTLDFEGEGKCKAKNIMVDALDSCEDDFYCFRVKFSE